MAPNDSFEFYTEGICQLTPKLREVEKALRNAKNKTPGTLPKSYPS